MGGSSWFGLKMEGKRFVEISLVVFLLIGFARAQGSSAPKDYKDPTGHPNLSPFEQWRSSYECLQNISYVCKGKYQLTEVGWINLTRADTDDYCKKGCADHTRAILKCIQQVKHDYKFEDKSKVKDINHTITEGCLSGFTGQALPISNARMMKWSKTLTYVFAIAAWLFVTYISM